MNLDHKLKSLLDMVSTAEDKVRSESRSEADLARSRAKLLSTLEVLPAVDPAVTAGEPRRVDQFLLEQLHGLLGGAAARRALELASASLGQRPEALTWDKCEALGAALRPVLAELVGVEIAGSVVERICLGGMLQRRP